MVLRPWRVGTSSEVARCLVKNRRGWNLGLGRRDDRDDRGVALMRLAKKEGVADGEEAVFISLLRQLELVGVGVQEERLTVRSMINEA